MFNPYDICIHLICGTRHAPQITPISFKKTIEEKKEIQLLKTKYSPRGAKLYNKPNWGNVVIHIKNKERKKDFKTTRNAYINIHDIMTFVNSCNVKKEDIIVTYFKGQRYDW